MNKLFNLLLIAALGLCLSTTTFAQINNNNESVTVTIDAEIPEALHIYILDGEKLWCTDMDMTDIAELEKLYREGSECGMTTIRVWANCPWELKCKSKVIYDGPKDYDPRGKGLRECFAMKFDPDLNNECEGKLSLNPDFVGDDWISLKGKTAGNISDWILLASKDVNNLCIDTDIKFSWYFGADGCLKKKMLPAGTYYLEVEFILCPATDWDWIIG